MSEANSGYIVEFHVYTGKNNACISNASNPLDQECSKTTKIVLGLLESTNLLDKGHHVYMDNYYSSPELFSELYFRQTYACGCQNRKGLLNAVKKAKLEPLQSFFLRNGPLLCLKWSGEKKKSTKKPVTILSMIHEASELLTRKKDAHGNRILKPVAIHQYTQNMAGVDISDQYMSFHVALCKSMKWSQKLIFHFLNMVILNAYLLNKKLRESKVSHKISHYLNVILHKYVNWNFQKISHYWNGNLVLSHKKIEILITLRNWLSLKTYIHLIKSIFVYRDENHDQNCIQQFT